MALERLRSNVLSRRTYFAVWGILIGVMGLEGVLLYIMADWSNFFSVAMVLAPMIILTGTAVLIFLGNFEVEPPRTGARRGGY